MSDYPKQMVHPAHVRGQAVAVSGKDPGTGRSFTDYHGTSDRYPPVEVRNADQEAYHRSLGYIAYGEKAPAMALYSEYPLLLVHPEHRDAIPPERHAKKDENGAITYWETPGAPEKFPHKQVADADEEAEWSDKGWRRPGTFDPVAVEAALASPHDPDRVVREFPKMVDGKLVEDPDAPDGRQEYPMWAHGVIVETEAEHREKFPADFAGRPEPEPEIDPRDAEITALKAKLAEAQTLLEKATAPAAAEPDATPRKGKGTKAA